MTVTHTGACHCGAVTFEVDAPADIAAVSCNCSICKKTGFLHLFATQDDFRILTGADNLTDYRFNTGVAKHFFCKTCGVKAFYVPRSHPDGWSINVNCLDKKTIAAISTTPFDGANWEQNIDDLRD